MPVLICLIFALVLFVLAALNVPSSRVSLGWAGAAFVVVAMLLQAGHLG